MPPRLRRVSAATAAPPADAQSVVETFLFALAAPDTDAAGALLAEDVLYVNVGLPPIRGRHATMRLLRALGENGRGSFEVYVHAIAADGPTVLTERTDVLVFGRVRCQFWVTGRFEVRDGQITLWRDSYDYLDLTRAFLRGVAGALVPALRPAAPASLDVQPGRH